MSTFNRNNIEELNDFLYNSNCHDSTLNSLKYDIIKDTITVELFNPIYKTKMRLTFRNVITMLTLKGEWGGSRETVSSITVEKDFSYFKHYPLQHTGDIEDSLYLLFQMFSGDEIHIVAKEVVADIM